MKFLFEEPVKFGVAILKNIKVRDSDADLQKLEERTFGEICKKWNADTLADEPVIKSFRELYWSYGMDPTKDRISSEALMRRVLKGEHMWRVNNVIDAMNIISAESALPIGVLDLEKISGDITVRRARSKEVFTRIGGKKVACKGGEIVVADGEKILDFGFATADTEQAKVTNKTKSLLVLIYATNSVSDSDLKAVLDKTVNCVLRFSGGTVALRQIEKGSVKEASKPAEPAKEAKKTAGMTVRKADNFSEWYTEVITKSEFADYSAVSGCIVYRPLSYTIWEKIVAEVDKRFKKVGIKNAYFPVFIPEHLLMKEAKHFEGFTPEVAWVTQAGSSKLDERLAVRPTSETIAYDSYSKWIRSWRDLPLRLNFWNSVVRWEFKHPMLFIRGREFLWQEGHTVFATEKEAMAEGEQILSIYKEVCEDYLALPGLIGRKTDKEKFAGAVYTESMEYVMPDKKACQGPDFHHDGQNFAKGFDITFLDKNEKKQYAWQNTWAISTRMLGILVATHGDDKGLVLPPKLAPTQAVIVPIYDNKTKKTVMLEAGKLAKQLEKAGISLYLDDRDEYSPGWKFNEWELKGTPLRIELGPKDLAKKQAVLVRRDTGEKKLVSASKVSAEAKKLLDDIQKSLLAWAKKALQDSMHDATSYSEFKKVLNEQGGFLLAPWCGEQACEDAVKDETGAKITNMPLSQKAVKGKCVYCGKPAKKMVYFAKSY